MQKAKKPFSGLLIIIGGAIVLLSIISGLITKQTTGFNWVNVLFILVGILLLFIGITLRFWRARIILFIDKVRPVTAQEKLLLFIGLIVGIFFCVMIPYGAGFDETAHLVRAYDISHLSFIPNNGTDWSMGQFYTYSYQRRAFQSPATDLFSPATFLALPDYSNLTTGGTTSNYFPLNYTFPAGIALFCWRIFNFPVLLTIILMRFAGFIFYLLACFWTIRRLPFGKWVFLVLALSPTALFQAATINADSFTNAISFAFIGYLLKVLSEKNKLIEAKTVRTITLLTVLLGCVKPGTILLFLLLIPVFRLSFESRKSIWILIGAILLSLAISIGWVELEIINNSISSTGVTLKDQVISVIQNPFDFLGIYLKGIGLSLKTYYTDWVGVYGYWVGKVPILTYLLYPLALVAGFSAEMKNHTFSNGMRLTVFLLGLMCILGIGSFQFVLHYTPGVQGTGAQGRYFVPFAPILFLAWAGLLNLPMKFRKIAAGVTLTALLGTLMAFGYGIYRTYYTYCVFPVTAAQPCYLPVYKNLDVVNRYVTHATPGQHVDQSFLAECKAIGSIKLQVESVSAATNDQVTLSLLDVEKKVIASQQISLSALNKGDKLVLPVELKAIPGQTIYWLELSLPQNDSPQADLGLFGRAGADLYTQGMLLLNNAPQDGDLFIQYECTDE